MKKLINNEDVGNIASKRTPNMPKTTKKRISKKCQSLSYVTWNSTSLPVRKGFMADSVTVAMSAQKKLRHIVLMLKVWLISWTEIECYRRAKKY